MSDAMRNQLEQAYNLIQNDQLDEAVNLLRPIVRVDPNNPDAWWLLANAVSDPNDAFEALNNVLRLEPGHEQAQDLLNNLLQEYPELATRVPRPVDTSTTSSGIRSTPPPAASDSGSFGTNWDAEFGETAGRSVSSAAPTPVAPNSDIDDFFSTLDPSAVTTSDFDSPTSSFETNFADNDFENPAAKKRATTEADLDSLFSAEEDDAEDMDTLFANSRGESVTSDDVIGDNDLDAMFATSNTINAERSSDSALQDPFNSAEPDFLQDLDTTPTNAVESSGVRRASSSKVATRTSGAIPVQDPFAAEARANQGGRSRNLVIGLVVIGLLAVVLIAVALLRPFSPPADNTATVTSDVALNNTTGDAGLIETVQQLLTNASFTDPVATVTDGKLSVKVCEKPGRTLRSRFNEATEILANTAPVISKQVTNAELSLVNCAAGNAPLYRATAPVTAITEYVDSNRSDVAKYRAAWVQS